MPPKRSEKHSKSPDREGRILLAIKAIQNQSVRSLRQAASVYNVPHTTLRDRINGKTYRQETRTNNYKLTLEEEDSLCKWILSLDSRGASPRPSAIANMANLLLVACGNHYLPFLPRLSYPLLSVLTGSHDIFNVDLSFKHDIQSVTTINVPKTKTQQAYVSGSD
jgi:hypothetical protein